MWLSPRAIRLHVVVVVVVGTCIAFAWWQLQRALSGNTLSWAYTFEWPFFGGYAVFMWWKLLHETPDSTPRRHAARERRESAARAALAKQEADEEMQLADYNRYLADLQEIDRSRRN